MLLILCTLVYVFFVMIDVIPFVKNKKWKVLAAYGVIFVTAYIFSVLTELGVKIPSPAVPLKQLVTAIVGKQT
jgi:hypothetical protein